jgi:organic radical activating enzyme
VTGPAPPTATLLDRLLERVRTFLPSDELALHREEDRHFLLVRPCPPPADETLADALAASFHRLRELSSLTHLERLGLHFGFRIEDLVQVRALVRDAAERDAAQRWLSRRLPRECHLVIEAGPPPLPMPERRVVLEAVFAERGELPTSQRQRYQQDGGRIRVEAFELHVVEHCNLSCAHCCNMSPYLDARFLPVEEIATHCRFMARHLDVDVFKIMGGEPLLHPEITRILEVLKTTGISRTIRLFTNGLLLHRMDDDFWRALDELTVSNYASAPVKPAHLELIADKARRFDIVLNIKPVDRFSQVMAGARHDDEAATQATYDACWLRHRCLIVRHGRFYKCTRAAYFKEYQERLALPEREADPAAVAADDGVLLEGPDFGERLLEYLNARTPLGSCRYCLGSSGPMVPHVQLGRRDVREGRFMP